MQDKVTLLREKWAEALESGKYEQHRGSYFPMEYGIYTREGNILCATALLWQVSQNLGFDDMIINVADAVKVEPGRVQSDNDHENLSFPEIAAKLRNGDYDVR